MDTVLGLVLNYNIYFGKALLENILQVDQHVDRSRPSSRVYAILHVENGEMGRGTAVVWLTA